MVPFFWAVCAGMFFFVALSLPDTKNLSPQPTTRDVALVASKRFHGRNTEKPLPACPQNTQRKSNKKNPATGGKTLLLDHHRGRRSRVLQLFLEH